MPEAAYAELAEFLRENASAVAEALNRSWAQSFPRASTIAISVDKSKDYTSQYIEDLAHCVETQDCSLFHYERAIGDALYDPNDYELTLFATNLATMMHLGRAISPVIVEQNMDSRNRATELLNAFEQTIQHIVAYNCQAYSDLICRPRALLSKWDTVSRLRRKTVQADSFGKQYLQDKDFQRIASRSVEMPDSLQPLSTRETTVLRLVLEGKSNAEIASALSVSLSTVKQQVSSILRKYEVSSRAELIAKAKYAEPLG